MRLNGIDKVMTREEALRLHREMWTDMQKELGDCPTGSDRRIYKQKWLEKHGYTDVWADCFLCEYAFNKCKDKGNYCELCPINWLPLSANELDCCISVYRKCKFQTYHNNIYRKAPISEILALPERSE